ncbi:MAG: nitroreductase family protein [Candidatus Marinimicrobia bacterium]|nr:nitroreductase family protein [Candidatus Neomarinimicrobiota bacterium]MDP6936423.1 nitroreductase family protein [Candidatus Neomarinimicrobiota bacterium]
MQISEIPSPKYKKLTADEMVKESVHFYMMLNARRTIRDFSEKPIPDKVIETCIKTAGTAPSGANMQPWHFVVVSDPKIKRKIRIAAEKEEKEFYENRAPKEWLEALSPLGTDDHKPYLEKAPCLIAIFMQRFGTLESGKKVKHYYGLESVGIATGMLITAIHNVGLASLTHTPSPMGFLNDILDRPNNERPFLLLVVGYPAKNAKVPDIKRKELKDILSTF